MGPPSSRCLLGVGGCRGCSVGFCLCGSNRRACRTVGVVWASPRIGVVVCLWYFLPYKVVVPLGFYSGGVVCRFYGLDMLVILRMGGCLLCCGRFRVVCLFFCFLLCRCGFRLVCDVRCVMVLLGVG